MTDFKELRQGTPLAGYTIERRMGQDADAAFYSVSSPEGERLLLKVAPGMGGSAEQKLAVWDRSRHLRHPNLLHLRDAGRTDIDGSEYIYATFESPDDSLASALVNGPISEGEARAVLESALAALRYLHSQGMVHGAVTPEHIVAVGDDVKLTTDALRESDALEGLLEDVRQLGQLVRRMRAPEPLEEPLATIVAHATVADAKHRWTLAEIARALDASPVRVPIPEPKQEPLPVPPPVVEVAPVTAAVVESAPAKAEPEIQEIDEGPAPIRDRLRGMPIWPFAAAAALILLILLLNHHSSAPPQRATTVYPAAATRSLAAPNPEPITTASAATWRVIAFATHSRHLAAKKAKEINKRWPEFHATVSAAKQRRGLYVVTLGQRMDREQAVELERKAHSVGLPRDTHLENDGGE